MKAVLGILGLIVALGLVYGLAFFGILPVQGLADKTPALAPALISMHLAKRKRPMPVAASVAAPNPQQQALDAQKKQLDADRAQFDKDRLAWEAQKQQAAAPSPDGSTPDSAAKLNAIYATMSPDDIARIFAKLPDPDVVSALTQMDEKKAGSILAVLPDIRAAHLTRLMSLPPQPSPISLPHTSL